MRVGFASPWVSIRGEKNARTSFLRIRGRQSDARRSARNGKKYGGSRREPGRSSERPAVLSGRVLYNYSMNIPKSFSQVSGSGIENTAANLEVFMQALDRNIADRARFSEEYMNAGERSPEDNAKIAEYDREIVRICRETCELLSHPLETGLPHQTEAGLLKVALGQAKRRNIISEQAADNIFSALESQLKTTA